MWKRTLLMRKGFCIHKVSPKSHALHQVLPLRSSNISLQLVASSQSSSHFNTWVSRKPIFSGNLRRFSTDSSVETPARAPPVSDIKLDMAESDQNVSKLDKILKRPIDLKTLFFEDDEIVEEVKVDVEKLEHVWSLLQSSGGAVDGSLIASLEGMGLFLSNNFLVRVVERLLSKEKQKIPIENLIVFSSWCMTKHFLVKIITRDALLWVLCSELKKSNAYALKDLGEKKESGLLNPKTLNKLIYFFSTFGYNGKAAFEVFNKFEEFGVADADTYYYTIRASWASPFDMVYVSQRMLTAGLLPNAEKVGDIIFSLCSVEHLRAAYSVYMLAKAKNSSPSMDIVNYLIHCLLYRPRKNSKKYHENVYLALGMLEGSGEDIKSMIEVSWKDGSSFYRVVRALCKIGDVEKAKELLFKMIDAGTPPRKEIFCEIISGYVERGAMEEAHKIFDEALKMYPWRNITPDIYKTLIRGYCELDQFDLAENFLRTMNDHGVEIRKYNKFIQSLRLKFQKRRLEEMQQSRLGAEGGNQAVAAALNRIGSKY